MTMVVCVRKREKERAYVYVLPEGEKEICRFDKEWEKEWRWERESLLLPEGKEEIVR